MIVYRLAANTSPAVGIRSRVHPANVQPGETIRYKGPDSMDISSDAGDNKAPEELSHPRKMWRPDHALLPSNFTLTKPRLHCQPSGKLIQPPRRPFPASDFTRCRTEEPTTGWREPAHGRASPRIPARVHKGPSLDPPNVK